MLDLKELKSEWDSMEANWKYPDPTRYDDDKHNLKISFFNGLYDSTAHLSDITWESFVEGALEGHQIWDGDKANAPLFNFVEFNSKRGNENAVKTHALMLDYDNGLTIEQARELFAEYEHIIYSSMNHLVSKNGKAPVEKFRVVLPLKTACPVDEWNRRNKYILQIAPKVDPASIRIAQCYTGLFTRTADKDKAVVYHNEGKFMDWENWIINPIKKEYNFDLEDYTEQSDVERKWVIEELKNKYSGDYNQWFKIGCGLKHGGYTIEDFTHATVGGLMSEKSRKDCAKVWKDSGKYNYSMGTVYHYIGGRRRFFEAHPEEVTRREDKEDEMVTAMRQRNEERKKSRCQLEDLKVDESEAISEDDVTYVDAYAKPIPYKDEGGAYFGKSHKGSGKTTRLEEFVAEAKKRGETTVVLGHRVNLLYQMAERLGLTNYKHIKWTKVEKGETDYLAICLNSIHRLQDLEYDNVLIDESEQVLQHLVGRTIKPAERPNISEIFHRLVKDAKRVICLDADLGLTTIEAIARIREEKTYEASENKYKVKGKKIHIWHNKQNLINAIERDIEAGKSVFIGSNSKNFVDYFSDYLSAINVKHVAISSDNSDTEKINKYIKWLGSTDKVHDNEVVLATPSLSTGVDIQAPFDVVYGLFEARCNTHFDFDQQILRVRHAGATHVWVAAERFDNETNWPKIKNRIINNDELTRELIEYNVADVSEPWFDMVLNLYSMVEAHQNKSMNALRVNFINLKASQGWEIEHHEAFKEEVDKIDLKGIKRQKREMVKKSLIEVEKIDGDYYDEIRNAKRKSNNQKMMVLRFEIENFFRDDVMDNPDIVDWYLDDKVGLLRRYERFILPPNVLEQLDMTDRFKHIIDRRNLSLRVETIKIGLERLNIWSNKGGFNTEQVMTKHNPNVNIFTNWGIENASAIKDILNLTMDGNKMVEKPIQVIKSFVALAGLKIIITGKSTRNAAGNYQSIYQLDTNHIQWLNDMVDKRQETIE